MEGLVVLVIIAIIMAYFNLYLIIKKEKPTIIINNHFPEKSLEAMPADKAAQFKLDASGTGEIPIESSVTVKDIKGEINLDSEKVGSSDVTDLTTKIKKVRGN